MPEPISQTTLDSREVIAGKTITTNNQAHADAVAQLLFGSDQDYDLTHKQNGGYTVTITNGGKLDYQIAEKPKAKPAKDTKGDE